MQLTTDPYVEGAAGPVLGTLQRYDALGRVFQTDRLSGVVVGLVGGETIITSSGSIATSTQTVYDAQGRVATTVAADGSRTDFEYDDLGRKVAQIGPAGLVAGVNVRHRIETVYDALGRVEQEITGIRVVVATGQIDRTQERQTRFAYDKFGRVDSSHASAGWISLGRTLPMAKENSPAGCPQAARQL